MAQKKNLTISLSTCTRSVSMKFLKKKGSYLKKECNEESGVQYPSEQNFWWPVIK